MGVYVRWRFYGLPYLVFASLLQGQISFGPSQEISDYVRQAKIFKVHDMDGDGDKDIIVAEEMAVRVLWYENDGSGNFSNRREWRWGRLITEVVEIKDFNGDGRLDIWVVEPTGDVGSQEGFQLWVAISNEQGQFAEPQLLLEGVTNEVSGGKVQDINGDGLSDLLIGNRIFLGKQGGGFHDGVESAGFDSSRRYQFFVDLDLDGDKEVLYESFNKVYVSFNDGGASLSSPSVMFSIDPNWRIDAFSYLPVSDPTVFPPLVLAITHESNHFLVFYQQDSEGVYQEEGRFDLPASVAPDYFNPQRLVVDETSQRLFLTSVEGTLYTSLASRAVLHAVVLDNGNLRADRLLTTGSAIELPPIAGCDLNGDTHPDLAISLYSTPFTTGFYNHVLWCAGDAQGGYQATPQGVNMPTLDRRLHYTGDLDGDGDVDFLTGGHPPEKVHPISVQTHPALAFWKNEQASFSRIQLPMDYDLVQVVKVQDIVGKVPELIGSVPGGGPHPEMDWADVVWPEGKQDILVRTFRYQSGSGSSGHTRIEWIMQGEDGVFHTIPVTGETSIQASVFIEQKVLCVDWNGDEKQDIVIGPDAHANGHLGYQVEWKEGAGNSFGANQVIASDVKYPIELADMDWDGDVDLLTRGALFGGLRSYYYENNGSGAVSSIHTLPILLHEPLGDLNGDGHVDFRGFQSIWISGANTTFTQVSDPLSRHMLDLDGDGDLDLLDTSPVDFTAGWYDLGWRENIGGAVFDPANISGASTFTNHLIAPVDIFANREQAAMVDIDGDGVKDLLLFSGANRIEWFKVSTESSHPVFHAWMQAHGLVGHSAGFNLDWDKDGVPNGFEFGFGGLPHVSDANTVGLPKLVNYAGGLGYSYKRRKNYAAAGLSYDHVYSTNLKDWHPWIHGPVNLGSDGDYDVLIIPVDLQQGEFFRTQLSITSE